MLGRLYENLTERATKFYHPGPGHAYNPCDLGVVRGLRVWGRAISWLGSYCRCCSGTRVLAVAILSLVFPLVVPAIVIAAFGVALIKELLWPSAELNEGYEAYEEDHNA